MSMNECEKITGIKRFIRVMVDKAHQELTEAIYSETIHVQEHKVGRISAFIDAIKFAEICKRDEEEK